MMKHRLKKAVFPALCLLAVLGMIFTGCSTDGDDDDDGPASITVQAQGVAYTFKAVPGGTVRAAIGDSGGPFSAAGTTAVPVAAFYMGETEVTYELWKAVYDWATDSARGANQYTFANAGRQGGDYPDTGAAVGTNKHPVTEINWRDAVVWCNAYSEAAGKTPVYKYNNAVLRESEDQSVSAGSGKAEKAAVDTAANGFCLPTEAEWEYAARGGTPGSGEPWTYTYAGSNNADDVAVYWDAASVSSNSGSTAAVKSKAANSLGLYDMSGNVYEWCQDERTSGALRVIQGGGWDVGASVCTVAILSSAPPNVWNGAFGFRVVCP
jgi:formylglycine-generating enzyme required for sulfatase activity